MAPAPIQLGALARVLHETGRMALRDGVELRSLSLTVSVMEPPVLDPARLWRTAVARSGRHWWERWLERPHSWPQVRLVWEDDAVFAQLEPNVAPPSL